MLKESDEQLSQLYDVVMFDMDGVVKLGSQLVPGASEHVVRLHDDGVRVAYVTNNASSTPSVIAEKLGALGLDVDPAEVVTSAQAAAKLVAQRFGRGARALVLGGDGLTWALEQEGVAAVRDPWADVDVLVSGFGPDVTWGAIKDAAMRVRQGLPYVASNGDLTMPTEHGEAPGHGSLVGLIAGFARVTPTVAGKPEPPLLLETIERTAAVRPLMVGDRLDTDILGAHRVGVDSLLVLTGVSGLRDLVEAPAELRPSYIHADLTGLHETHPVPSRTADGGARLGGWTGSVVDGALTVVGAGSVPDWWRVAATAAWAWLDREGRPADISQVRAPVAAAVSGDR